MEQEQKSQAMSELLAESREGVLSHVAAESLSRGEVQHPAVSGALGDTSVQYGVYRGSNTSGQFQYRWSPGPDTGSLDPSLTPTQHTASTPTCKQNPNHLVNSALPHTGHNSDAVPRHPEVPLPHIFVPGNTDLTHRNPLLTSHIADHQATNGTTSQKGIVHDCNSTKEADLRDTEKLLQASTAPVETTSLPHTTSPAIRAEHASCKDPGLTNNHRFDEDKDPAQNLDDRLLWCEGCESGVPDVCRQHGRLNHVPDSVVPTRALLTAPSVINVKAMDQSPGADTVYSCFAKKLIVPGTQFGPYEGTPTSTWTYERKDRLKVKLFGPTGGSQFLSCDDQTTCNWMIFIQPARDFQEQNLVAYQYKGAIYYTVIKAIPKNEELKVWYAKNYALFMGETVHQNYVAVKREKLDEDIVPSTNWRKTKGRKKAVVHYYSDDDAAVDGEVMANVDTDETYQPSRLGPGKTLLEDTIEDDEPLTCGECGKSFGSIKECTAHDCKLPEKISIKLKLVGRRTRNKRRGHPLKVKKKNRIKLVPRDSKPKVKKVKPVSEMFPCDQCGMLFPSSKKLDIHSFSHSGEMRFKCDFSGCDKGFNAKSKLLRHQLVHNDNREYQCNYCEKAFLRKDHLKNHLKVHGVNNEKHQCDQCAKEYTCLFSFKVHLGIHAAERGDRNCAICQEEFENQELLEHHLKLHSRARTTRSDILEKNHGCPVCSMKFYTMLEVRRHMLVHTKEKHFLCQFCPQQFGRKDHLIKHMKAHHRSELPDELLEDKKQDRSHIRSRKKTKPVPTGPITTSSSSLQTVETYRPVFTDDMAALQNVSTAGFSALQASYSEQVLRSSDLTHTIHSGYQANTQQLGMNFSLGPSNVALEPQAGNNYQVHVWQPPQCQWPQNEVKK